MGSGVGKKDGVGEGYAKKKYMLYWGKWRTKDNKEDENLVGGGDRFANDYLSCGRNEQGVSPYG